MRKFPAAVAISAMLGLAACGGGASDDSTDPEGAGAEVAEETAGGIQAEYSEEAAALVPEEIRERGHMVWTAAAKPPFYIEGASGEFTGLGPDIEAAAEQILDLEIEFLPADGLQSVLLGLQSGRADFFVGGLRATAERQQDFDFVVWLSTNPSYLFSADRADEISGVEDLCGLTVSFEEGGAMEMFVDKLNEECAAGGQEPIEPLPLVGEGARLAVDSGRADAYGANLADNLYTQLQREGEYEVVSQDTGTPDMTGGVAPAGSGVGEAMQAVFEELFEQGVYEELMTEWNMQEAVIDEPTFNPF
ncbi:transporter substrate-binding domain-containing protein [Blastococcus montanus]|uniref:transporter substrate-binding domain-containing protein n=1 Tax=Blastococcus montanus TaxID=3144973 RepID=UPI003209F195